MSSHTAQLIGLAYSPWTEKARWALDYQRIAYRYHEHLLLFGMPELRWRTGRWTGPLTVPAYRDADVVLTESWDIARLADQKGAEPQLFPAKALERIAHYNRLGEKAADAARTMMSARILRDPEARIEVLPAFIPGPLRRFFSWLVWVGVTYVRSEFGFSAADEKSAELAVREIWTELARDLRASGGEYLVGGRLSYADIAMAVTLIALEPASIGPIRLGPAYRRCWATPAWHAEFSDLIVWRDRLYARHRGAAVV